jgi:hypothetical protein
VSTFAYWWGFDSLGEPDDNEDFYSSGDDTESSFVNSSSSVSASTYSAGGPGHASMLVGYGYLQGESSMGSSGSTAFAGVLGDPSFGGGFENGASGRFEDDTVVITAPGMSGQGTFTALFQMDLHLVNDTTLFSNAPNPLMPDTYAMAELRLRFNDVNLTYEAEWNRSYPGAGPLVETHTSSFPEGIVGVPVTFTYGQPFTIRGRARLDAGMDVAAGQLAQGRAIAQLPGSFHWLGMEGLPAGATVQGAIDWSQPAPLPQEATASGSSGGGGAFGPAGWLLLLLLFMWRLRRDRVDQGIARSPVTDW